MNVKEAAKLAKEYVADLFADEGIANVGLEEIQLGSDGHFWKVTVGFSRPWGPWWAGYHHLRAERA